MHLRHIDGIFRARSGAVGQLDRQIDGVDVMENVFRGVQLLTDGTQSLSDGVDLVDPSVRAWLGGTTISAVTIRVLDPED
jgi:hypothetical protein